MYKVLQDKPDEQEVARAKALAIASRAHDLKVRMSEAPNQVVGAQPPQQGQSSRPPLPLPPPSASMVSQSGTLSSMAVAAPESRKVSAVSQSSWLPAMPTSPRNQSAGSAAISSITNATASTNLASRPPRQYVQPKKAAVVTDILISNDGSNKFVDTPAEGSATNPLANKSTGNSEGNIGLHPNPKLMSSMPRKQVSSAGSSHLHIQSENRSRDEGDDDDVDGTVVDKVVTNNDESNYEQEEDKDNQSPNELSGATPRTSATLFSVSAVKGGFADQPPRRSQKRTTDNRKSVNATTGYFPPRNGTLTTVATSMGSPITPSLHVPSSPHHTRLRTVAEFENFIAKYCDPLDSVTLGRTSTFATSSPTGQPKLMSFAQKREKEKEGGGEGKGPGTSSSALVVRANAQHDTDTEEPSKVDEGEEAAKRAAVAATVDILSPKVYERLSQLAENYGKVVDDLGIAYPALATVLAKIKKFHRELVLLSREVQDTAAANVSTADERIALEIRNYCEPRLVTLMHDRRLMLKHIVSLEAEVATLKKDRDNDLLSAQREVKDTLARLAKEDELAAAQKHLTTRAFQTNIHLMSRVYELCQFVRASGLNVPGEAEFFAPSQTQLRDTLQQEIMFGKPDLTVPALLLDSPEDGINGSPKKRNSVDELTPAQQQSLSILKQYGNAKTLRQQQHASASPDGSLSPAMTTFPPIGRRKAGGANSPSHEALKSINAIITKNLPANTSAITDNRNTTEQDRLSMQRMLISAATESNSTSKWLITHQQAQIDKLKGENSVLEEKIAELQGHFMDHNSTVYKQQKQQHLQIQQQAKWLKENAAAISVFQQAGGGSGGVVASNDKTLAGAVHRMSVASTVLLGDVITGRAGSIFDQLTMTSSPMGAQKSSSQGGGVTKHDPLKVPLRSETNEALIALAIGNELSTTIPTAPRKANVTGDDRAPNIFHSDRNNSTSREGGAMNASTAHSIGEVRAAAPLVVKGRPSFVLPQTLPQQQQVSNSSMSQTNNNASLMGPSSNSPLRSVTPRPMLPFQVQTQLGVMLKYRPTSEVVAELATVALNLKSELEDITITKRKLLANLNYVDALAFPPTSGNDAVDKVFIETIPESEWPQSPHFLRTRITPHVPNAFWGGTFTASIVRKFFEGYERYREMATFRRDFKMLAPRMVHIQDRRKHVLLRLDVTEEDVRAALAVPSSGEGGGGTTTSGGPPQSNVPDPNFTPLGYIPNLSTPPPTSGMGLDVIPFGYVVTTFFLYEMQETLYKHKLIPNGNRAQFVHQGEDHAVEMELSKLCYNFWHSLKKYRHAEPLCDIFLEVLEGQIPRQVYDYTKLAVSVLRWRVTAQDPTAAATGSGLVTFNQISSAVLSAMAEQPSNNWRSVLYAVNHTFKDQNISAHGKINIDLLFAEELTRDKGASGGELVGSSFLVKAIQRMVVCKFNDFFAVIEALLLPYVRESSLVPGLSLLRVPDIIQVLKKFDAEYNNKEMGEELRYALTVEAQRHKGAAERAGPSYRQLHLQGNKLRGSMLVPIGDSDENTNVNDPSSEPTKSKDDTLIPYGSPTSTTAAVSPSSAFAAMDRLIAGQGAANQRLEALEYQRNLDLEKGPAPLHALSKYLQPCDKGEGMPVVLTLPHQRLRPGASSDPQAAGIYTSFGGGNAYIPVNGFFLCSLAKVFVEVASALPRMNSSTHFRSSAAVAVADEEARKAREISSKQRSGGQSNRGRASITSQGSDDGNDKAGKFGRSTSDLVQVTTHTPLPPGRNEKDRKTGTGSPLEPSSPASPAGRRGTLPPTDGSPLVPSSPDQLSLNNTASSATALNHRRSTATGGLQKKASNLASTARHASVTTPTDRLNRSNSTDAHATSLAPAKKAPTASPRKPKLLTTAAFAHAVHDQELVEWYAFISALRNYSGAPDQGAISLAMVAAAEAAAASAEAEAKARAAGEDFPATTSRPSIFGGIAHALVFNPTNVPRKPYMRDLLFRPVTELEDLASAHSGPINAMQQLVRRNVASISKGN